MDRLWSPWRYRYITESAADAGEPPACVFCAKFSSGNDEAALIVHRAEHNAVLLNLYPYTSGHLMVIPYAHVSTLDECPANVLAELILLAQKAERRLREEYRCEGLNIGFNIGACAGAGVAGHLHLHLVPRWPGDANFMTTVGETRVLPEELSVTYRRLATGWE
ncbi:MAG: HIT domain-containing protein [Acidobacteria bacterium]|nr:HIT domain-containing protein [Acidobacteriota bacterium]